MLCRFSSSFKIYSNKLLLRYFSRNEFTPIKSRLLPDGAFDGRIALITGGGTGLGRGMTAMISGLGAKVAIASR